MFDKHQASTAHHEILESLVLLPSQIQGHVGEMCNHNRKEEKRANGKMFMQILQNIRFLACQGLPLRGSNDDTESNFIQLLHLHNTDGNVDAWLSKKFNKYTLHDINNIILKEMANKILCDIGENVHDGGLLSIKADECTDCSNKKRFTINFYGWIFSNKEQFTINFRWVDSKLQDHTEFIGLYSVDSIDAKFLVTSIKDVLFWMNLTLSNCRGQCYNGASNTSGAKGGVVTQLIAVKNRALYTHCYCHALNLAIADTIKQSNVCRNVLETACEITKLVKFLQKEEQHLIESGQKIKIQVAL